MLKFLEAAENSMFGHSPGLPPRTLVADCNGSAFGLCSILKSLSLFEVIVAVG